MEFDAYALLVDLGFISLLLLVGMLVRAKIGLWQMLLVPASITAGLLGLALGPNAAGLIPFSDQIAEYPTVLIAVIFASIPLAQSFELRGIAQRAGPSWVRRDQKGCTCRSGGAARASRRQLYTSLTKRQKSIGE